ncbi:hypothetical protein [Massilia sp. H6]|uniref:hypothetical protein n=1 Tax=Massilia sp. H6 TaxID=2970464 RepID=UPI00216960DB|nr:hypothetical protein [Massilia sp. H6]UVW26915.1 hypothetical protein NRS07_10010 [Massilia sp. H6]
MKQYDRLARLGLNTAFCCAAAALLSACGGEMTEDAGLGQTTSMAHVSSVPGSAAAAVAEAETRLDRAAESVPAQTPVQAPVPEPAGATVDSPLEYDVGQQDNQAGPDGEAGDGGGMPASTNEPEVGMPTEGMEAPLPAN